MTPEFEDWLKTPHIAARIRRIDKLIDRAKSSAKPTAIQCCISFLKRMTSIPTFNSNPNKMNMKTKTNIIVGSICAVILLLALVFSVRPYKATAPRVSAYPEKAEQLGKWIDEQSALFDNATEHVNTLNASIDAQTKQLQKMEADRLKAAETAKGYRHSLCAEFGLQRAMGRGEGVFVPAQDCASFQ